MSSTIQRILASNAVTMETERQNHRPELNIAANDQALKDAE